MKYTTVVFDLGNVLILFDHNKWVLNFNKIENKLGTKYIQKFKENINFSLAYESGKISEKDFIDQNLTWLENKVNKENFIKVFSEIFNVNQEVVNLLPKLKEKYKLVLLSNTNSLHQKYGWGEYPFIKYFDRMILSYEIGMLKPEACIYQAVEHLTKEKPETHIFIDDIKENVGGAKKIGWDGIQFKGYENLIEEFKLRKIF